MGLLDGALGALMNSGSGNGAASPVAQALQDLMQQHGGIGGLVQKLSQGGLAQQVQSWIGTGANLPVNAGQISQALGNNQVTQIAQQLGVDPQHAGGLLAQVLPHLIDHFTPNGQLPAAGTVPASGMLGAALNALVSRG